jgi:hypothetical protein
MFTLITPTIILTILDLDRTRFARARSALVKIFASPGARAKVISLSSIFSAYFFSERYLRHEHIARLKRVGEVSFVLQTCECDKESGIGEEELRPFGGVLAARMIDCDLDLSPHIV